MADPDAMRAFCDEMSAAGCDWQVHAYGQTLHAFTNPNANDPASGTLYNEVVANRAYQSMAAFLAEVLN
jgi:dienelactone hydrolase